MQPANAVIVSDGLNVDGSKGLRLLRLLRRKSNMETATGCVYVCVTVYVCDMARSVHKSLTGHVHRLILTADDCWFSSRPAGVHSNALVAMVTGC